MKTNQILIRPMGSFSVSQRTSDGMFNATELLKQWNSHSGQQKGIHHFFDLNSTKEFINAIIDDESKERNSAKITLSSIYTKNRGVNGGTWMHPLLFIDFAMWLNPTFKVKVLKFVYDQLLAMRNEAGDSYILMCKEISQIVDKEKLPYAIQNIARGINFNIYGDHESNIRNSKADENLMKELVELQKHLSRLINERFLKSFDDVMTYLRLSWRKKYEPKLLSNA